MRMIEDDSVGLGSVGKGGSAPPLPNRPPETSDEATATPAGVRKFFLPLRAFKISWRRWEASANIHSSAIEKMHLLNFRIECRVMKLLFQKQCFFGVRPSCVFR